MSYPLPELRLPRLLLVLGLCAASVPVELEASEFRHNFGGASPHPALQVYGKDCNRFVKREDRGIRITLPRDREERSVVGVSPVFSLAGDFEVTFGYEILKADAGKNGQVGVNLRLMAGNPVRQVADMGHYCSEGNEYGFVAKHTTDFDKEERQEDVQIYPTKTKLGSLRLERKGATLCYLVAEGRQKEFRELRQAEFISDDCKIRLATIAGKGQTFDVRYLGVEVRADELPNALPEWTAKSRTWLWWLFGSVVAAGGVAAFLVWRWGSKETPGKET